MTTPQFVEGNASEYNLEEDYASEDYDSEDYTEAAPDSNLVESVYYDVLPDVLIDGYVPAHAAPTIEADNAIEQSVVVEAVEADATLELEIAVEESIVAEAIESDATLESEIAVEEDEDTMSEWSEEEDEDVISEYSEETWVESEDEDMISEASEEASEDEAWVAGEEGFTGEEGMTIQDLAESNTPLEEETWIASEEEVAIQDLPKSNASFQEGTWIAGEGVMIEAYAALCTPFEVGTGVAIEESGEEAVEAITTMITIPAATSTSLIPMWSTSTVIEATGDSTVPTHDWEAFFGCSPMVMLQECRTTLLTVVENFFIEVEQFRIRLRRFINSVLGKWKATTVD